MMHENFKRALGVFALAVSAFYGAVDAQTPTATLTITNDGNVSGAVGVQPVGNVCNPNAGGGGGGAPCTFTYPVGTPLRITANSPSTPGIFNSGTGDAVSCATSTCVFTLNGDSSITATFNSGGGPYPSLTIGLLGDGKGNVGTDNNQCQNFELGWSGCTTYYGAGSVVRLEGRSLPGNIFAGFSGGTSDAAGCAGTEICSFTLSNNSTLDASFSAVTSVAITPSTATTSVGGSAFFNAQATFANGMTRYGFNGNSPWQSHVPMDVARFSLAAATVDDRLYAIGGADGVCASPGSGCPFAPLNTVEIFNPEATLVSQFDQAWTARRPMTIPREGLASVVLNGKIYAIGGHTTGGGTVDSVEFYDPSTNAWSDAAPMPAGGRANMAAAVIGSTIYVVGGDPSAGGEPPMPLTTVEAYDGSNWTTKAPMLMARRFPAAAAVNGILYAIGGDGIGSVEAFDPTTGPTGTWTLKAPMPNGGGSHEAVALNGLIYAVGGSPITVKIYNPALDAWLVPATSMPLPVNNQFALAVLDGRLFAAGGMLPDQTAVRTLSANRPPEATWWSSDSAVGRINNSNNGGVQGVAVGTATISARLVTVESASNGLLTVNAGGGGGGSMIFLGIPTDPTNPPGPATFTQVGQANWGCGTFGQNGAGPWEVTINYGEGGGDEVTPYSPPPAPCGGGPGTQGWFSFNHAYSSPGVYAVTVTVTNTSTSATTTRTFHIEVQDNGGGECVALSTNFTAVGSVPFSTVQLEAFDRTTGDPAGSGDVPFGPFELGDIPEGLYRIELSVPNGYTITPSTFSVDAICGQAINLTATVQAIPAVPPTISVRLSPTILWPANNKLVNVNATIVATSPNGHATTVTLVSITSSDPDETGDIKKATVGTDDRAFQLRAEKSPHGPGRIYTVTYRATDSVTGLSTTVSRMVLVPHDRGIATLAWVLQILREHLHDSALLAHIRQVMSS
ncbi:MAG: Ig-like domain-containing protein [Cyanobacteria bacterium]|nr:Ig-like domain-containing protein [Cyanobacteriota bacterium]